MTSWVVEQVTEHVYPDISQIPSTQFFTDSSKKQNFTILRMLSLQLWLMESECNINMDASTVFKNLLTIVGIVCYLKIPENMTKKT